MDRKEIIKKLDREFSRYIRVVHSVNGITHCITCQWADYWENMDCGHYMSRKHMFTRWDPDNARPQCKKCNQFYGGKPKEFRFFLGEKLADQMEADSRKTCKWTNEELEDMLSIYRKLNKALKHDSKPRQG